MHITCLIKDQKAGYVEPSTGGAVDIRMIIFKVMLIVSDLLRKMSWLACRQRYWGIISGKAKTANEENTPGWQRYHYWDKIFYLNVQSTTWETAILLNKLHKTKIQDTNCGLRISILFQSKGNMLFAFRYWLYILQNEVG